MSSLSRIVPVLAAVLMLAGVYVRPFAQTTASVKVIAYGDARFTDPANVTATNPRARAFLIARIAEREPDAVLISGDVPWHGGTVDDYARFRIETLAWRSHHLRVIPALGNHEFSECQLDVCLENWWTAFPE